MIVDNGLNLIVQSFMGSNNSLITYIAVGDGVNPINFSDSSLSNERYRVPISNIYKEGSSIFIEAFVDRFSANFTWTELGLFSLGDATLNSGTLLARTIVAEDKNDMRTATITWEINIDRR
jgi:hypothetical protein